MQELPEKEEKEPKNRSTGHPPNLGCGTRAESFLEKMFLHDHKPKA